MSTTLESCTSKCERQNFRADQRQTTLFLRLLFFSSFHFVPSRRHFLRRCVIERKHFRSNTCCIRFNSGKSQYFRSKNFALIYSTQSRFKSTDKKLNRRHICRVFITTSVRKREYLYLNVRFF